MNTVKSFWYGWGALIVAGGGAYIFARRDIDADRRQKALDLRRRRHEQRAAEFEYRADISTTTSENPTSSSEASLNPASEASQDPAATRHEPRPGEKSKFEANKGEDR
ncbi:hypothetical protein BZA77DRAFT_310457 [Pyronema omphalodes]|nr:hypothetical protein BZA77DRAFT_310457 [Pyronema omphalodes]